MRRGRPRSDERNSGLSYFSQRPDGIGWTPMQPGALPSDGGVRRDCEPQHLLEEGGHLGVGR
jgi:hypothetical protein